MVFGAATATAPAPDPAIMLFGRRISVLETPTDTDVVVKQREKQSCGNHHSPNDTHSNLYQEVTNSGLVPVSDNHDELTKEVIASTPVEDDIAILVPNDSHDDKNQECSMDDNSTLCANNDQSSQQKVLKKPDKILPCPRCNSLDTKFCYYNNYNVNQPRYYCKNCERYWTDGGTMRNVPVGAGRRKNKHTANHYRIPDASEGMAPLGNNIYLPSPGHMPLHEGGNTKGLKFRSKESDCQSETDLLNLGENGKVKQSSSTPSDCERNLSASVMATDDYTRNKPSDDVSEAEQNASTAYAEVASVHPVQCYPGNSWAFLRNPGWNNPAFAAVGCTSDMVCGENGSTNLIPWNPASFVSASAFVSPAIPFSFIPASFWGCMTSWPAGPWNAPLVGYNGSLSLSSSSLASPTSNEHSDDQSLKMGKRLRDESLQVEDKAAASLWFPQTLRIDDPDQASKSSIWATLGITHDQSKPVTKGTMFKCFQSGTEHKILEPEVLDANPAALSRSQAFQESS